MQLDISLLTPPPPKRQKRAQSKSWDGKSPWRGLKNDVVIEIFRHLSSRRRYYLNAAGVCREWRDLIQKTMELGAYDIDLRVTPNDTKFTIACSRDVFVYNEKFNTHVSLRPLETLGNGKKDGIKNVIVRSKRKTVFEHFYNIDLISRNYDEHVTVLESTGDVYTWGTSCVGQLGHGPVHACVQVPTRVDIRCEGGGSVSSRPFIVGVHVGVAHTVMWDASGQVYTLGDNSRWQLGQGREGKMLSSASCLKVEALRGKHIIGAAAHHHTVVWSDKGEAFAFGDSFGNDPIQLDYPNGVQGAAVEKNTLLWTRGGTAYTVLSREYKKYRTYSVFLDNHHVKGGACGGNRYAVFTAEGKVFVWGKVANDIAYPSRKKMHRNTRSMVVDINQACPLEIADLPKVVGVALSKTKIMAWTRDGRVICWGSEQHDGFTDVYADVGATY